MDATLASIVAAASPLIYAVVGETIAEKAGVINLSLDGSIMLSAMAGFATAYATGSVLLGFVVGAAVSMAVALLVAFASIELRLNQIAVGFVLTLLCADLASFLGDPYVGQRVSGVPHLAIPGLSDDPLDRADLLRPQPVGVRQLRGHGRRLLLHLPHAARPGAAGDRRAPGSGARPGPAGEPVALPVHRRGRGAVRYRRGGLLPGRAAGTGATG